MTRKHFEALAAMLNSLKPVTMPKGATAEEFLGMDTQWRKHVRAMANFCATHNGQFNKDRFYAACGMEG